jgi:LssY C-terminus
MSFAYALLALNLLGMRQVPTGTQLHVRLLTTIGTYASRPGDPVRAVLIAPVASNPDTPAPDALTTREAILPAGSILSGTLKSVQRVGLGLIHENGAFELEFTSITTPSGTTLPLRARVQAVDNGRERVTRDGSIRGIRATNSISYRFSGYVRTAMQWEIHAELAVWAIRALMVQVPESELYYPAGVELTLGLAQPLPIILPSQDQPSGIQKLASGDRARMEELISALPRRTHTSLTNRPSDLINLLFVGSREELTTSFEAAGWAPPDESSLRSNIRRIRAVAEGRGDPAAPMSLLLVDDTRPDMSWQKGFNDVSKRHHIRIWKQSATWNGREVWIGAATRDIDFAFMRPGWAVTHKIEEDIDRERDKVVNDLAFTSCVNIADEFQRPDFPGFARNATGDSMLTDTRVALVGFGPCASPPAATNVDEIAAVSTATPSAAALLPAAPAALPRHGSKLQRFVRREILCFRSDLLRENAYWRTYEGIRYLASAIKARNERSADPAPDYLSAVPRGQSASRSHAFLEMLR